MIRANHRCLEQALALLDALDDDQYATRRGEWSPIGAQLRHVVEHYQSFAAGLPTRSIDYDARPRDTRIETSRLHAAEAVRDLIAQLAAAATVPATTSLQVTMECSVDAAAPAHATSSVGRELQFLVSHTVHHFALIRLLLASDGVTLDPDFGVAPSTLRHARATG